MSEVKRYDQIIHNGVMEPMPDGKYVTYSDYQKLVAENAAINDRLQKLILIVNNSDNSYCMCGDSMESHAGGGCGSPTGMFDYHYNAWLESEKETPATDAAIAEIGAKSVDEYALAFRENTNMDFACNRGFYHGALDFAANLRAGRKG